MKTIGSYKVIERLGTSVFLVERGRRTAVLKMLQRDYADAPELVARCFNDACTASATRHTGIAKVYDVGLTSSGRPFIVSELVDGESLSRTLGRGPMPLRRALRIARRIARAIAAAHERGVAHCALEPDNIILHNERIKLVHFGVARLGGGPALACIDLEHPPIYAAPEQCRAASTVDERSDLYALGCIIYALIAGRPPFISGNVGHLLMSHLVAHPPVLAAPQEIRELVAALMSKHPGDRPTAAYVVAILDGQLRDVPTPGAFSLRWVAALLALASLA